MPETRAKNMYIFRGKHVRLFPQTRTCFFKISLKPGQFAEYVLKLLVL